MLSVATQFWENIYAEACADRMVQEVRGDPFGIRAGVLRGHTDLEDEERRETGREFQVIHPHAPQDSTGPTVFPLREVRSAGVARLQE
jgi:hypothetical protein